MKKIKTGPKPGKHGKKLSRGISLSEDIWRVLPKLAASYGITVSAYIERAVLEKLEKK